MSHDAGKAAGTAEGTTLPEHDRAYCRQDEEQDVRLTDGSWCPVQQKASLRKKYFDTLLERVEDVPDSVKELLKLSRSGFELFDGVQKKLVSALRENKRIQARVLKLMTIPGVGEVTALTWVLEIGELDRFSSSRHAISYCGLCSAQHESAGKEQRGPISKQRNKHLQTTLIEAAKLAPRWNEQLAMLHEKELARGNRNRATLAVARKLVEFMMAVDRRESEFEAAKLAA